MTISPITFVKGSPASLIKDFLYRGESGNGESSQVKVISEGIKAAPQRGGTTVTEDQLQESLAVLEHRIVQKIMELSSRIKSLEEENRKLWAFVKKNRRIIEELEQNIDAENWVSEELRVEQYLRSEQRFRDFGKFAMGVRA